MKPIALIGLGLMGKALIKRLLKAGYTLRGYDVDEGARLLAQDKGVDVVDDVTELAGVSDIFILSLPTSIHRRELLWGVQGLAGALPSGTLLLDTTTGDPNDTESDAARLLEKGIRLVDVCISGSSQVTAEGRALALVGDTEENALYHELLTTFSKAQYYLGAPGKGNAAKLIVNLVFGLNRLVLAEALHLAEEGGFDTAQILEMLKQGETHSTVMDTKGKKMLSRQYEPVVARLAQHAKDVGLILDYAQTLGTDVPVSALHHQLIQNAVEKGFAEADNAAILEAYPHKT